MVWGARVFDFALQIAATGIGAYLAYVGGAKLLNIELETERQQRIKEREADDEQNRDRVIGSLIVEVYSHKEHLPHGFEELLTFSFDGIIASGLYTYLGSELQEIVSDYYQGCHQVNRRLRVEDVINFDRNLIHNIKNHLDVKNRKVLETLEA